MLIDPGAVGTVGGGKKGNTGGLDYAAAQRQQRLDAEAQARALRYPNEGVRAIKVWGGFDPNLPEELRKSRDEALKRMFMNWGPSTDLGGGWYGGRY